MMSAFAISERLLLKYPVGVEKLGSRARSPLSGEYVPVPTLILALNPALLRSTGPLSHNALTGVVSADLPRANSRLNLSRCQSRGAMWTAGCLDRNSREAEWAIPRHSDSRLLFVFQTIHLANKHEYHESNNKEVGQGVEENAVIDRGCTRSFGLSERGICMSREVNEFVREIRVACEQSDRGHQDIGDEGAHHSSEGCANDDAHCHVEHAATHCKLSEFSEHPAAFASQQGFRAA